MKLRLAIQQNLNFFRVHLLFFIFTPLIFSAIFFVSNGSFHISYIDSLFVCVSSITVTGLTTVDLSGLTGWQQAILFIQVCIGNVVAIAWVTVWYRRRLFIHKFNHLLRKDRSMKHNAENEKESIPVARHRGSEILARNAQDHLSIQHDVTLKSQLQRQHPSNNKATHSAGHNASYEAHPTNAGPRSKEPVPASSLDQHYAECAGGPSKAHLPTVMSEGRSKDMALGGFSSPHSFLFNFIFKMWPGLQRRWATAITQPHLRLFTPHENSHPDAEAAPYLKFAAFVGKNSRFFGLKKSHKEELGNMEYQALTALMWIVAVYHIGIQIICFTVLSPYMSAKRWRSALDVPQLHRNVSPVWFAIFLTVTAYSNAGMSLVDQSLLPFQRAYLMLFIVMFCTLAGYTALPVFLRFVIWIIKGFTRKQSQLHGTLHFLLDHPRRYFAYLFPSNQTILLLVVLMTLWFSDWIFFLILNIGNPVIDKIPTGLRVLLGLVQSTSIRAAGYNVVPTSALAPAVKVMFVIMMYISSYPLAMSTRSTNVYEEISLGTPQIAAEINSSSERRRVAIWGRHLAVHVRQQLAFDMWWLGLALFIICIVERDQLEDDSKSTWFNIFNILFELVSAYNTVGLSLGLPDRNYSLSGAFRPLSKLIMCAVMLRGRHKGLPHAVDRAIALRVECDDLGDSSSEPLEKSLDHV